MRAVLLVAALFIASSGFAQSKEPPKPSAEQQSAQEQRGAEASPLFVKVPRPATEEERAAEHYEKVEKPRNERFLLIATVLLAIFTGGLFWATWRLVRDSKETGIKQTRAYVAIPADGLRPGLHNQSGSTPRMLLVNFGRSPAYRTSIRAGTSRDIASIDTQTRRLILRGHVLSAANHVAVNFAPEIPQIPVGFNDSFCIHGEIDYTDVFGNRYRHHFVWVWGDHGEATHNFMPHPTGNYEQKLGKDPEFRPS